MTIADLTGLLAFSRGRIDELAGAIAATGRADDVLRWRPGPGRANLGWQLLHVAATDHRFETVRLQGKPATEAALVADYGFGSAPNDAVPGIEEIVATLARTRASLLAFLGTLPDSALDQRPPAPPPGAPAPPSRTFREWLTLLAWHEGHHHGQAHLTFNLWKAAHPEGS